MVSRIGVIDLSQLPEMAVLEDIDTEEILAARMDKLVELWKSYDPPYGAVYDVQGLEFDPIKINQECSTFHELLLRDRVNQACRSITLAYAVGTDLDAIASRYPGGVPRLTDETDERYRRRIWLSPNVLTPHGTGEAYVYWAMTSDAAYKDASATAKRGTGIVTVTCLLDDASNPIPAATQLSDTYVYINEMARKGLTDVVNVVRPKVTQTKYRISYKIVPTATKSQVEAQMQTSLQALVESNRWLGSDHTLMDINAACAGKGVYNVVINEPAADVIVGYDGFVQVTAIELTYAGTGE